MGFDTDLRIAKTPQSSAYDNRRREAFRMSESLGFRDVAYRYRKPVVVSLLVFFLLVPVFESAVIQRDRNRNMVYGELFWHEGLGVYDLNDQDLFYGYGVPEDHLLTGVLNVTYEYPIVTLVFYAVLAIIEPGVFGPFHYFVNWILVVLVHLNLLMFLYLGRAYLEERWFRQLAWLYYSFGFAFSVVFPKVEPFVDFLLLTSLVLFHKDHPRLGFGILALAFQAKVYPVLMFPILVTMAPLASLAFFGTVAVTLLPLVASGMVYESLIAHILNSPGYATMTTNPFFVGFASAQPLALIAPSVLVLAFFLVVLKTKKYGPIVLPRLSFRTRDWRAIFVSALPLVLILFSWTQIWYYSWFVIPVLLIRQPEDMARYRWMFVAIWTAHFVGILLNLEYFLSGPIAALLDHLRP